MPNPRFLFTAVMFTMLNASIAFAATAGRTFMSPKLEAGEMGIHSACMMPAEGKLSRLGMKGREGMSKESEAWSSALDAVVAGHLKATGIEIIPSGLAQEDLERNEELQRTVLKLQAKYDSVSSQIERHPKDTRKDRFTVGDEVALLPCTEKADILVYVHGQGQVLTGGKAAFGILIGGPSSSMGFLKLSLVDAKSGDILAYMRLVNNGKFADDSEKAYGKELDKLFKKMRIGNAPKKKKD